jgi:hypothetical protein
MIIFWLSTDCVPMAETTASTPLRAAVIESRDE